MDNTKLLNRNYEAISWGALFVWWGITEMVKNLPDGTEVIGIGLILLGLNTARYFNNIPISRFTTILGILALVWGVMVLAGTVLSLPFDLPVFAILLIVLGLLVLVHELTGRKN